VKHDPGGNFNERAPAGYNITSHLPCVSEKTRKINITFTKLQELQGSRTSMMLIVKEPCMARNSPAELNQNITL